MDMNSRESVLLGGRNEVNYGEKNNSKAMK